jgi:hypothetical protein
VSGYRFTADSIDDFYKILYHLAEEAGRVAQVSLLRRGFRTGILHP